MEKSNHLHADWEQIIVDATHAESLTIIETIQNLWSGYGKIFRARLSGKVDQSVVIKHVRYPSETDHPLGWSSDLSHQRKVRSYKVETAWYRDYAARCTADCRVPLCITIENHNDELIMVLEDLDAAGFPLRKYRLSRREIGVTLWWLAHFHAAFLGATPTDLWQSGTYWHLQTRPDELATMGDESLRHAAASIDEKLSKAKYQTLVHGDAKVANFCYSRGGKDVAAVDFQYVGGGCGMKDVAYFLGSCMHEDDCERYEKEMLDEYFSFMKTAMRSFGREEVFNALETEWRELYHWAWVDFHRFLKGWSAKNWYPEDYSERLKKKILHDIAIANG